MTNYPIGAVNLPWVSKIDNCIFRMQTRANVRIRRYIYVHIRRVFGISDIVVSRAVRCT